MLHFAGYPTESFTNEQLGLDGHKGALCQNRVFQAVFEKLRACNGGRRTGDYIQFVSWLVCLDILREFPSEVANTMVQSWFLSMRVEFCDSVSEDEANDRCEYDPQCLSSYGRGSFPASIFDYRGFESYNYYFHPVMLSIVLEYAPQNYRLKAIEYWLTDEGEPATAARKRIFHQNYYPLNTFFEEYYLWNTLVMPITAHLPSPLGAYLVDDFGQFGKGINLSSFDVIEPKDVISVFGRTLKCMADDGVQHFCKIQSVEESEADFFYTYQVLKWVWCKRENLQLESEAVVPESLFKLDNPEEFLRKTALSNEDQIKIKALIGHGSRLVMLFSCPIDKPYDQYVYDVPDPEIAMEGLIKYASDYGRLWFCGLLGPSSINAYHDSEDNERHIFLCSYVNKTCEGALERWNRDATNYPNVGGRVGMRDRGDIRKPDDVKQGFVNKSRDASDPLANNKKRLNELGRTAQGVVLLYSRCFHGHFDHSSSNSVKKIEQEVGLLLAKLFCQAAPLSEEQCLKFLQQDDLLAQCAREVSYWTAKDVPYVKDLRKSVINRDVYPHLPIKMRGAILAKDDWDFLTDKGFHDPKRDQGDECQLGSGSGRNPLIALNALITKMLCHIVVATCDASERMPHNVSWSPV